MSIRHGVEDYSWRLWPSRHVSRNEIDSTGNVIVEQSAAVAMHRSLKSRICDNLGLILLALSVAVTPHALAAQAEPVPPDCSAFGPELAQDWGVDLGMAQVPLPSSNHLRLSNGMEPDTTSAGYAQVAAVADLPLEIARGYMLCAYQRRGFSVRTAQERYSELAGPDGQVAYLAYAPKEGSEGSLIMVTLYLPPQPPE